MVRDAGPYAAICPRPFERFGLTAIDHVKILPVFIFSVIEDQRESPFCFDSAVTDLNAVHPISIFRNVNRRDDFLETKFRGLVCLPPPTTT